MVNSWAAGVWGVCTMLVNFSLRVDVGLDVRAFEFRDKLVQQEFVVTTRIERLQLFLSQKRLPNLLKPLALHGLDFSN